MLFVGKGGRGRRIPELVFLADSGRLSLISTLMGGCGWAGGGGGGGEEEAGGGTDS